MDITINNVYYKNSSSNLMFNKIIVNHYKQISDWPNKPAGSWELGFMCNGKINIPQRSKEFLTIHIDPKIITKHACVIVYHNQFDKHIELVDHDGPIPGVYYHNDSNGRKLFSEWDSSKWYLKISEGTSTNPLKPSSPAASEINIASGTVEIGDDRQTISSDENKEKNKEKGEKSQL